MIISTLALTLAVSACPANAQCAQDGDLLAVSTSQERADLILSAMQTAQARYTDVFDRVPGLTAVVEDGRAFPGLAQELMDDGYIVKPWISPQSMREQFEAQLRPALEAQMADQPQAVIDAAIDNSLAQRVDGNNRVRHGDAIIAHELGHMWLMKTYDWPEIDTGDARAYGAAAAPDWFDETAAVLMETDELTSERRSNLCAGLPENAADRLNRYFTMEHPLLQLAAQAAQRAEAAERAAGEDSSGPRIMMFSKDALEEEGADLIDAEQFYGLTRSLVDYLVARTGSETIFDTLAQALVSGQSFDSWLASGVDGLPGSQQALIDDLAAFIESGCAV